MALAAIPGTVDVTAGRVTAGKVVVTAGNVVVTTGSVTAGRVVVTLHEAAHACGAGGGGDGAGTPTGAGGFDGPLITIGMPHQITLPMAACVTPASILLTKTMPFNTYERRILKISWTPGLDVADEKRTLRSVWSEWVEYGLLSIISRKTSAL